MTNKSQTSRPTISRLLLALLAARYQVPGWAQQSIVLVGSVPRGRFSIHIPSL
jgi:hypothetical protein